LRKLIVMTLMLALFLTLLPRVEAQTPTHVLVVVVSESGGSLNLVRILGRDYTLQVLPKAAQLAVLGHTDQGENLYKHLSMPEIVSRLETALGISIARYLRFEERMIVDAVERLGGVAIAGQRQNGADVLALFKPAASDLHARSIGQIEVARAIVAEGLRLNNWGKLPNIVRALFASTETNYTLTSALALLVQRPTSSSVVYLDNPAILFAARYLPQHLPLPLIVNGRSLMPLRVVEQISGATVSWHEAQQRATITKGSKTIDVVVGQATAWVNGNPEPIDIAPLLRNGRTMVPVRFIFEQLGLSVEWVARDFVIKVGH